jgi:hypothetical protein
MDKRSQKWERCSMIVVGAHLLSTFWARQPASEAQLRAFHALLSRAAEADLGVLLAGAHQAKDGGFQVGLEGVAVRLRLGPGGVAKIEAVVRTR